MAEQGESKKAAFVGGAVFLVIVLGIVGWGTTRSRPVSTPASYVLFVPGNKIYTCKVPSNWEDVNHLKSDVSGLGRFCSGRGEIVIDSDMLGSLMADISRATAAAGSGIPMPPGLNLPAPKPAIEDAHDMDEKKGEMEFKNYHEDAGRTWTGPFGEERFSEFTGEKGTFGGDMHGYRATMLTRDKRVTVWCWCPESDWTTLKPVFGDIINSVSPGTGTG